MLNDWLTDWLKYLAREPCFQVHGKSIYESTWRVIHVHAISRRDRSSRWPLWRGTCITWTSSVIAVGLDFAHSLLHEQAEQPNSREFPLTVQGGRLLDRNRRARAGASIMPSAGEVMAHEIGHTWQALRLGPAYLPLVGAVTLFREGDRPWNYFENQASAVGMFGGIVNGSVRPRLD